MCRHHLTALGPIASSPCQTPCYWNACSVHPRPPTANASSSIGPSFLCGDGLGLAGHMEQCRSVTALQAQAAVTVTVTDPARWEELLPHAQKAAPASVHPYQYRSRLTRVKCCMLPAAHLLSVRQSEHVHLWHGSPHHTTPCMHHRILLHLASSEICTPVLTAHRKLIHFRKKSGTHSLCLPPSSRWHHHEGAKGLSTCTRYRSRSTHVSCAACCQSSEHRPTEVPCLQLPIVV